MRVGQNVNSLAQAPEIQIGLMLDETGAKLLMFRSYERLFRAIKSQIRIDIIPATLTEEDLIERSKKKRYDLLIVPWRNYITWTRLDSLLGGNQSASGSIFAGYVYDAVSVTQISREYIRYARMILLDFFHQGSVEALTQILALADPYKRTGIKPLLAKKTQIYCETWYGRGDPYQRSEILLSLPRISEPEWQKRANSLRLALIAFWSMVYEKGPGKGELIQSLAAKTARAYFQVGVDHRAIFMRLCLTIPNFSSLDAINAAWPHNTDQSHPAQILAHYCDFLRITKVADTTGDIEIVAGFFYKGSTDSSPQEFKTLWISLSSSEHVVEVPFIQEGHEDQSLHPFPTEPHEGNVIQYEPKMTFSPEVRIKRLKEELKETKLLLAEKTKKYELLKKKAILYDAEEEENSSRDSDPILRAVQARYQQLTFELREIQIKFEEMSRDQPDAIETAKIKKELLSSRRALAEWTKKFYSVVEVIDEQNRKRARGWGG